MLNIVILLKIIRWQSFIYFLFHLSYYFSTYFCSSLCLTWSVINHIAGKFSDCNLYLWDVFDDRTVITGPPYCWNPAAFVIELSKTNSGNNSNRLTAGLFVLNVTLKSASFIGGQGFMTRDKGNWTDFWTQWGTPWKIYTSVVSIILGYFMFFMGGGIFQWLQI